MTLQKKLHRSGPYADLFSQGVQVGNTLYLAGQVGMDDGGSVPEDLLSQMKLAYQNVASVLAEFGADMDNIVDETWFVTDVNDCMAQGLRRRHPCLPDRLDRGCCPLEHPD